MEDEKLNNYIKNLFTGVLIVLTLTLVISLVQITHDIFNPEIEIHTNGSCSAGDLDIYKNASHDNLTINGLKDINCDFNLKYKGRISTFGPTLGGW